MQKIVKIKGVIESVKDLSPTSRKITFSVNKDVDFLPGSFFNFFYDIDGEKIRRAYSISSDSDNKKEIEISIRRVDDGKMSKIFWEKDIVGKEFDLVGALGLNTIDKIKKDRVFLFSFGIGISVIKGILHGLIKKDYIKEIIITTGDLNEEELIYDEFLNNILNRFPNKIKLKRVLSNPKDKNYKYQGYIQNNIKEYNFDNSDIYLCGRESYCQSLTDEINNQKPQNINFLVESFH